MLTEQALEKIEARLAQPYPMDGTDLVREVRRLQAEVAEHNASFDLYWRAQQRGVDAWREAHPASDLVMPDAAAMTTWLLDERTRLLDALLVEFSRGDEARLLDAENAGSQITAEKLLEIARTGEHSGVFGGETIEACAQAILRLRAVLRRYTDLVDMRAADYASTYGSTTFADAMNDFLLAARAALEGA